MNLQPQEYEKIIDAQQSQIDELCAIIHAIRGNKIANHMPFVARLVSERNELELQRATILQEFYELNSKFNKCKYLTEHWIEKSPQIGS